MYFANPLGLIGLIALPAILYIHIYRRRFPPREVAGLFLWLSPHQKTPSGTKRQRIPLTLSLLLELLAALLIALLLSDPRVRSKESFRHLVFVLDNSASMAATDPGGETAADRAVAFVRREVAREANTHATLILTGARPQILGRTEAEPAEAADAVTTWRPALPSHSAAEAIALGIEVAGLSGEVLFLTDHLPPEPERNRKVTCVAMGRATENVGFVAADWTPGAAGQLFVAIRNFSSRERTFPLTARVGAATLPVESITLAAGAQRRIAWGPPAGAQEAVLDLPADPFDLDNHVVLVAPPRKPVNVASVFPGGAVAESVVRALGAIEAVRLAPPESAHLIIAPPERYAGPSRDDWWLVVGPLAGPCRGEGKPANVVGPFLVERTHPLLEGVTLDGVIWAGAAPGGQGLAPIVSGADRPLIASLQTPQGRVFWLNVDLGRSNLARSPDWPILLHNLVGLRRRALPGLDKRTFRLGDDIQCQRPDPEAVVTAAGPGGFRKTLAPSADIYLSRLTEPGIYQLEAGGQTIDRFALNLLDDKESDLAGLSTGRADAERAAARTQLVRGQRPGWLGFVLGGLALAALLGNWRLNYRRADDA